MKKRFALIIGIVLLCLAAAVGFSQDGAKADYTIHFDHRGIVNGNKLDKAFADSITIKLYNGNPLTANITSTLGYMDFETPQAKPEVTNDTTTGTQLVVYRGTLFYKNGSAQAIFALIGSPKGLLEVFIITEKNKLVFYNGKD